VKQTVNLRGVFSYEKMPKLKEDAYSLQGMASDTGATKRKAGHSHLEPPADIEQGSDSCQQ
jgi:hypothetical protein